MSELTKIQNQIFTFRGQQVMVDRDLAAMYQVETKMLNQAVKRNIERVPESFRFQMTENEVKILRSQFVTGSLSQNLKSQNVTSSGHGGRRALPAKESLTQFKNRL